MVKKPKVGDEEKSIYREIRRIGVMIENTDSNVRLLAEQYGDIRREICDIHVILDSHGEMIAETRVDIVMIKEDIVVMKADIVTMKEDIQFLKKDTASIKNTLDGKVDKKEFLALGGRVSIVEKRK
jgi:peptidoglycan hydrolase CwlO-like protein